MSLHLFTCFHLYIEASRSNNLIITPISDLYLWLIYTSVDFHYQITVRHSLKKIVNFNIKKTILHTKILHRVLSQSNMSHLCTHIHIPAGVWKNIILHILRWKPKPCTASWEVTCCWMSQSVPMQVFNFSEWDLYSQQQNVHILLPFDKHLEVLVRFFQYMEVNNLQSHMHGHEDIIR
jgi:hypothetical protein